MAIKHAAWHQEWESKLAARKTAEKSNAAPLEEEDGRLTRFVRRHAVFLVILAVAAVCRFVMLFVSQTHVHSDEAIIGLMAKHIREGRYLPFYMYGQPYNAGEASRPIWLRRPMRFSASAYCR